MPAFFSALIGWGVGALVNYLSDVLPWRRRLVHPFCASETCQKPIPWINYLFLPRRCPSCGRRRGWRAWLVEAVFIILAILLWRQPVEHLGFWGGLLLLAYFGVVVVIDMEYRLILHPVSLFGAVMCLALGAYLHGFWDTLLGGAVGFGVMLALHGLGALWLKLASRRRGEAVDDVALGFGDVNLGGVIGLLLGYPGILGGLMLAVFLGGLVSLIVILVMLILRRYNRFAALPYGPFLVAGAVILIFLRQALQSLF